MNYFRVPIAIDVTKVNRVSRLPYRFAYIVLTDANGRVLRTRAARHVVLCPGKTIIYRECDPACTSVLTAGRVWHIYRAIWGYFHVPMNAAGADRRIVNANPGTKRLTAVITARALSFSNDVLRAVVNGVRRAVRYYLRRRRWGGIQIIRAAT